jgi:hypothetical protein
MFLLKHRNQTTKASNQLRAAAHLQSALSQKHW